MLTLFDHPFFAALVAPFQLLNQRLSQQLPLAPISDQHFFSQRVLPTQL